jgi:ribonuclease HI
MGVIFSRKKNLETSLILNGVQLQFSKSFNFLGFWFDCHLTWSQHINYIVQRSKSRINLLKCISHNEWGADRNTLLLVYRALIRSLLDYGCMLYKSASKHLLKKLDAVQCTSLSLVAGAMKGTALSSLLHDCDELPLNLRRDMLSAKYLAKILSCPGHIAHEITRIASMKQFSTNFPCRWGTEINLIHALCKSCLISGECTSLNPPWTLLGINTDTNIAKLFSPMQLRSSSASNKITKYISEMYPSATLVYADGSCSEGGRAAAGIYVPQFNLRLSFRLSDNMRVGHAELEAIFSAFSLIISKNIPNPVVITDCMDAIQTFSVCPVFDTPLAHICRDLINSNNIAVTIVWVPGHVDLIDHDIADQLAKSALDNVEINKTLSLEVQDFNILIKKFFQEQWTKSLSSLSTGRSYHTLFPCGRLNSKPFLPRKKDTTITRLRFHNCHLNNYLHKIGLHQTGLCSTCNVTEDVEHFLLYCSKHMELSSKLKDTAMMLKVVFSLTLILSEEPFLSIIYSYICENNISV